MILEHALTVVVHTALCDAQVLAVVLGNPKPDSKKGADSSSAGGSSKSNGSSLNGKRKRAEAASSSGGGSSSSSSSSSKSGGSTTAAGDAKDADDNSAADGSDDDADVDVELKEQLQTTFSYDVEGGVPTKATLVVTPASLMGQVSSALLRSMMIGYVDDAH
jgi:hypothetical protein